MARKRTRAVSVPPSSVITAATTEVAAKFGRFIPFEFVSLIGEVR